MLDFSRYEESSTLVFGLVALGLVGFGVLCWRVRKRESTRIAWCVALAWGWGCVVAILTFVPGDLGGTSANLIPFDRLSNDSFSILNLVLNVLLFVPAGVLIVCARVEHPALWAAAVVVGSVCIEFTQHYANLHRSADVNDVIASTVGLGVGLWLARRLRLGRLVRERDCSFRVSMPRRSSSRT